MSGRCVAMAVGVWVGCLVTQAAEPQVITLEAALRLAGARNLSVEVARERVREARSRLDQDRERLLPWIAPGVGYRRHDGNLQDIVGDVFEASKQSGNAAVTVQAQLDLGESIYQVLASRQTVAASEAAAAAQRRATLLAVAGAYTELCRATAAMDVAEEAGRISESTLRQVREAVDAGLAFAGDARRAEVQLGRNETRRLEARQEAQVASARLAQLLRLPPADELRPDLGEFVPVILVSTNQALDALVASALGLRPELHRAEAAVRGAQARRDGTTKGPWVPTLGAQATFGGLAGGRDWTWANGDDYQDYGVGLWWRLGPGGIGDRSRVRSAESQLRIAELEREQTREDIVREVVELRFRAGIAASQAAVAGRTVASARTLLELTQSRREFGVGAVLEAIEAEREYTHARADQLRAVANHNLCQWQLWHVTGQDETPVRPATP